MKRLLLTTSVLAFATVGHAVQAQEASETGDLASEQLDDEATGGLNMITVTAQRHEAEGRYRSYRVLGFHYLPTGNSGSDLTIDASLSFQPEASDITITAFVRKLTNEAIASNYQVGAGNLSSSPYEPPRTYGVRARFDF